MALRKYPDIRVSVWSDVTCESSYENWGMPEGLPTSDTHEYPYEKMVPFGDSARVDTQALPSETFDYIDSESMVAFGHSTRGDTQELPYEALDDMDIDEETESEDGENESRSGYTTDSGSETYQSDFSRTVEAFDRLERRWVAEAETGAVQAAETLREIQEMEVEYAVRFGIYRDLVSGNKTELGIARAKTHNRMQTRKRNLKVIGLPVKGRAVLSKKKERKPRQRIDPQSGLRVHWEEFRKAHDDLPWSELKSTWKQYPRKGKPTKFRVYKDEALTWCGCYSRWGDFYERADLHRWFIKLPRVHKLPSH